MDDGIDRSQWRLDDPEWVKKREEDWLLTSDLLLKIEIFDDDVKDIQKSSYKDFFLEGIFPESNWWWSHLAVLFPEEPKLTYLQSMMKAKIKNGYYK